MGRWLRHHHPVRLVLLAVTLIVAAVFLAPKASEALDSLHTVSDANPWWLFLAAGGEAASLAAFSVVTWALIAPKDRPSFGRVFRLDLVTIALSHAVPAGSAAGTALGYELLEDEGVPPVESGFVKVSQSLLAGVSLQALLGIALALELVAYGSSPATIGLAAAGSVLVVLVVGFAWTLGYRPRLLSGLIIRAARTCRLRRWLRRLTPERIERVMDELSCHMRTLFATPRRLVWVGAWSAANWVFDLVALWASLRAFGAPPNLILLLAAFCIAQVVASLPISPAGLGIVEGALVPALTGFGTPSTVAVLGVLTWRLFNYWLPLPVGAGAYVAILMGRRRRAEQPAGRVPVPAHAGPTSHQERR